MNKTLTASLSDHERFPLIQDLSLLNRMKQDACAPVFNFQSGDRLQTAHLEKVQRYAHTIREACTFWKKGKHPDWLNDYYTWCSNTVPIYKERSGSFEEQPTICRADIASMPWQFVSGDAALEDLLVYHTSGTTGPAMNVLFDPVSQACWLPQLQSILDQYNITLDVGSDTVAIALICSQPSTLTYASLSSYLEGAGILKINLHPDDWKDPAHIHQYLEQYNPQVLTGDPFAFMDLLRLKPQIKPKALVSSAMKLTAGIRTQLEQYFNCPVLDIYSLTECRMVAVAEASRYRAIRPDLYVEVFDPHTDTRVQDGERGELVITGGNNPFLPLIRYRTGDYCRLEMDGDIPYLADLEARSPVVFYTLKGIQVNTIEISRQMTRYPLAGFTLHQDKDYRLTFTGWSEEPVHEAVAQSLKDIFGNDIPLTVSVERISDSGHVKKAMYTSAFRFE